jgi:D-psicose/D-tagatose/L-ribulose 3-epimerase
MKLSICSEVFEGWPIERVFDYTAALGYDGVEIAPFTLADSVLDISAERRREIRRAAERSGIAISGLHWLLVKPEGLYINHPDEAVRKRTVDYLRALIHFCSDLGGTVMVHGSPDQRKVQPGWDPAEAWKHTRETFGSIAETAGERGVTYCVEPLTRGITNIVNSVDEAIRLVNEVNHPNLRTMVDCRSAWPEEPSITEAIKKVFAAKCLGHVHVNDPNLRGPGFGSLQFTPILKTLLDLSYSGWTSVEVFDFTPDPQTIAAGSLRYLRGILEALKEGCA